MVRPCQRVSTSMSAEQASSGAMLWTSTVSPFRMLREFLESKGYRILEAQNGRQALELAEKHPGTIEVLVTDVIMPQIRGLELAKRVTELYPGICVIFMSGHSEDALVENRLLSESRKGV